MHRRQMTKRQSQQMLDAGMSPPFGLSYDEAETLLNGLDVSRGHILRQIPMSVVRDCAAGVVCGVRIRPEMYFARGRYTVFTADGWICQIDGFSEVS